MAENNLYHLTIAELGAKIAALEISPVELTETCLSRIEAINPVLNSFITVADERARAEAKVAESELASGRYRGPLHGIPIAIKDIIDTEGVLTTQGSGFYRHNIPVTDAACVQRLKNAGAIMIGKCNTGEFAAESGTQNPHFGPCRNPWDIARVPSGSSGGGASAVAASMIPGAIGSDTGGSIRGPAAICGTVGLKPTYGRISVRGVYPHAASLDHLGPLARSVRDCALLLQVLAGYDPLDPYSANLPVPDFAMDMENGVTGTRLALCPDLIGVDIDQPITDAFEEALETFRQLGAMIEVVPVPFAHELNEVRRTIAEAEFHSVHGDRFAASPEGYSELLQGRIAHAGKTTLKDYISAQARRTILTRMITELFAPYDAMLLPGYPCLAAPVETMVATVNGKEYPFNGLGRNLLGMQNLVGFPCLSVPTGFDPVHGLPMSLQITTLPGQEATAFRIGRALEAARQESSRRRPDLDR